MKRNLDRAIVIGIIVYYVFIFCRDYRDYSLSIHKAPNITFLSDVEPSINVEDRRMEKPYVEEEK